MSIKKLLSTGAWQSKIPIAEEKQSRPVKNRKRITCSFCGHKNLVTAIACTECGGYLPPTPCNEDAS